MSYDILYGYTKHQVGDTADDTYVADMADTQYWSLLTVPTVKSDPLSFLRCFLSRIWPYLSWKRRLEKKI